MFTEHVYQKVNVKQMYIKRDFDYSSATRTWPSKASPQGVTDRAQFRTAPAHLQPEQSQHGRRRRLRGGHVDHAIQSVGSHQQRRRSTPFRFAAFAVIAPTTTATAPTAATADTTVSTTEREKQRRYDNPSLAEHGQRRQRRHRWRPAPTCRSASTVAVSFVADAAP